MDIYDGLVLICITLVLSRFIVKVIQLKKAGIKANKLGEMKNGFEWLVEKTILPLAGLFVVELIIHAINAPVHVFGKEVILSPSFLLISKPVGLLGLILSIIILFLSLQSFGASYRLGIDQTTPGILVEQGIFRLSRNPIYLGLNGVFFSSFLIYGSIFFLSMTVGGAMVMHFMVIKEEQALKKLYGKNYENYLKKVPRYIGIKSFSRG